MPAGVLVDAEGAVKAWAKAQTAISAIVGSRVFFEVNGSAPFPQLVVQRVGGGPLPGEPPIDQALIQFDVWGTQSASGKADGKASASALAEAVRNAAFFMTAETPMGAAAGLWAEISLGPVWSPDPESGRARYVVDVLFGIRGV